MLNADKVVAASLLVAWLCSAAEAQLQPDYCGLMKVKGFCRGYIPRFWFNPNMQTCEEFIYGGCGGNENSFSNFTQCMQTCGPRPGGRIFPPLPNNDPAPAAPENLKTECYQRSNAGHGQPGVMMMRWWFNAEINACQRFTWSGAGGNMNNFGSREDCEEYCSPGQAADPVEVQTRPQPKRCQRCDIGHCHNLQFAPSDFGPTSPYATIFLDLQATCDGVIEAVSFIDAYPQANKTFHLAVWSVFGLNDLLRNRTTGLLYGDMSQVQLRINSQVEVRSDGSRGWQRYQLPEPLPITMAQFIGIHAPSLANAQNRQLTVPMASTVAKNSISLAMDQFFIQQLPLPFSLGRSSFLQMALRRPALYVHVNTDGIVQNLGPL